jgi:hypothetical protein
MINPRTRRWWPQMNDHLPPARDRLAPRCGACHHPSSDHPDGGPCARWLTNPNSPLDPPEVRECACRGLVELRLPGVHAGAH